MQDVMSPIGTPDSKFHDGNPATGELGTLVTALWLNAVQSAAINLQTELKSVLTAVGIPTDATKINQLYLAIRRIVSKGQTLTDTGAANAYTAVNSPALALADLTPGLAQQVLIKTNNTGASTYSPDGVRADPIYGLGLQPLQGGELVAGATAILMLATIPGVNGGAPIWVLLECIGGAQQVANGTKSQHAVALGQLTSALLSLQSLTPSGTDNSTKVATTAWAQLGFAFSLGTTGYIKFPQWMGGLIIQWGVAAPTSSGVTVTFPIAFPNNCFCISTGYNGGANFSLWTGVPPFSKTGFTFYCSTSGTGTWIAIGN